MTPQEREHRAAHARALLEDPLLVEAWNAVEQSLMQTWRTSMPDDTETREDCWHQLRAISRVRNKLQQVIADGKHHQPRQDQP